eukprot:4370676-Prymnesium_polylepis.2
MEVVAVPGVVAAEEGPEEALATVPAVAGLMVAGEVTVRAGAGAAARADEVGAVAVQAAAVAQPP